ncbi:hypothetical protein CLV98_10716 [Dyadobacter jejuensis]|uniref:Uncharacterized protein n=1 Tax=Dyadobacter jejuensis TaxID=1082580 RepID=A0A316AKA7_9BACT|nr:hypothetical protein [Dyadobacter jejuensis]PWJ57310.1 hypothetical protein CLV98_10716 [Dyadobacter jejuensis]
MVNSINLIAFGTFGNPNGFKQTFFVGSKELAKSVKTFDINTNAIKLFNSSKVFSIRKEYVNGFNSIAYSIYTYAKEQNSDRSGTFIGSSILFTNKIAKEHIVISQITEFHNQLVSKNVSNNTISVNHSDKFTVVKPKDFDKIEFNLRDIQNLDCKQNTDKNLVVFCSINQNDLNKYFEKSIDLLSSYDTIYFTDSHEVAEFVHQKGVFKLIQNVGERRDFDREVNNLIEERQRKREQSILDFEKEIQKISEDKLLTIQEFKKQIEQAERDHLENEKKLKESKEDINKIGLFYDDFINNAQDLINQLRHNNGKLEEVKQIHNCNKILFNNGISDLKRPNYTTTIPKPKPKGILNTQHQGQEYEYSGGRNRKQEREEVDVNVYKIDIFKVATLVLAFLLIVTWVYFLFYKSNSENKIEVIHKQLNTAPDVQHPAELLKIVDLNPISNSILNENYYRIVAKYLKPNMKLDDVVKVIFSKNPTAIRDFYSGQEEVYSKHLLERNMQCFEVKEGVYYFSKDTLRLIPSYKK